MGFLAWAYDKKLYFITDAVDAVKGSGHSKGKWKKEIRDPAYKAEKERYDKISTKPEGLEK